MGLRCDRCKGFIDHSEAEHRHLECHCPDWDELDSPPNRIKPFGITCPSDDICFNPTPGFGYRLGAGFMMMNQVDENM